MHWMRDHQWVVSYVRGFLEAQGHSVEEAPMHSCSHDLLVDDRVRIEVKTCRQSEGGLFKFVFTHRFKVTPHLYVFAARVRGEWEYCILRSKNCAGAGALWFRATDGEVAKPGHALAALPRLVRLVRGPAPRILRVGLNKQLGEADRQALKKLYATGSYTYRSLGRRFGVSGQRVWQLLRK